MIIFLIIDGVLYFIFSALVSEPYSWILLIPFVIVEILLVFVTLIFLSVPFAVYLKYHLLSFLEAWFAGANIPFFDEFKGKPEIGTGTEPGDMEQSSMEQYVPEPNGPGSGGPDPSI
ncbi:hypothetical protein [Methanosarcina horonobensis]|uniref:hypothetical protein n=1 Tax=Methanosarcina horonobensis TaxID=418008 RepID=UPI000AFB9BAC|nr:hypothetical protein [Methanosarcina horonobensis]